MLSLVFCCARAIETSLFDCNTLLVDVIDDFESVSFATSSAMVVCFDFLVSLFFIRLRAAPGLDEIVSFEAAQTVSDIL